MWFENVYQTEISKTGSSFIVDLISKKQNSGYRPF